MAKKLETIFQEKVRQDLKRLKKSYFVKIQQVTIRGTPDLLGCINGIFVAIELKRDEKQKPDKLQEWNLSKFEEAGGISFVAHPGNWSKIFNALRRLAGERVDVKATVQGREESDVHVGRFKVSTLADFQGPKGRLQHRKNHCEDGTRGKDDTRPILKTSKIICPPGREG